MRKRLNCFQILLLDLHPGCISFSFIFKVSKNKSYFQHLIFLQPSSILLELQSVCVSHSVTQSCPTLRDPMDCSLPGSSVHGILQARTLEWVAISFSRGSFQSRDPSWVSCIAGSLFYHLSHQKSNLNEEKLKKETLVTGIN